MSIQSHMIPSDPLGKLAVTLAGFGLMSDYGSLEVRIVQPSFIQLLNSYLIDYNPLPMRPINWIVCPTDYSPLLFLFLSFILVMGRLVLYK